MTADPVTGLMTGTAATGIGGYMQEMDDPDPAGDGWERIRVQCLKIA